LLSLGAPSPSINLAKVFLKLGYRPRPDLLQRYLHADLPKSQKHFSFGDDGGRTKLETMIM
jgi:hypothetical protein